MIYLLLGANLGNRNDTINKAIALITKQIGQFFVKSSFYETAPWGKIDQAPFLNIALGIVSEQTPHQLLANLQAIEKQLGRVRNEHWGARTIDIDIILFDSVVVSSPNLQIPHPLMQDRRFVLEPLAAIAPLFVHPILHKTVSQLLDQCADNKQVIELIDN